MYSGGGFHGRLRFSFQAGLEAWTEKDY